MKTLLITIGVIFGLVGLFLLVSSPAENSSVQANTTPLSISTINQDIASGASLIDVRTLEEYRERHIEGAERFGLIEMETGSLPDKDKEAKMYIYCRSGNRSAQAKQLLEQAGFTNVIDLGAFENVVELGGKIVQ